MSFVSVLSLHIPVFIISSNVYLSHSPRTARQEFNLVRSSVRAAAPLKVNPILAILALIRSPAHPPSMHFHPRSAGWMSMLSE